MADINAPGTLDVEALKLGLAAYSKSQLQELNTIVVSAKASIDATVQSLTNMKTALQAELAAKGLESKEAALKSKLNTSVNKIAAYTSKKDVSITSQIQVGLLASSLDVSLNIDDQAYANILFELARYRYLISECQANITKHSDLSAYYTQVLSAISTVLPTAQP